MASIVLSDDGKGTIFSHFDTDEAEFLFHEIFELNPYFRGGISLHDNDVVLDVGANFGLFSIFCSQQANDVHIIAVEPVPDIFELLDLNLSSISSSCGSTTPLCCAIGNPSAPEEKTTIIFFPSCPGESTRYPGERAQQLAITTVARAMAASPSSSSAQTSTQPPDVAIIPPSSPPSSPSAQLNGQTPFPLHQTDGSDGEPRIVALRSLSSLFTELGLSRVDLLKVDCEGDEENVFLGLLPKHAALIRQVVVEVHDIDGRLARICSMLAAWNFIVSCSRQQTSTTPSGYTCTIPLELWLFVVHAWR